jgi:tetratricopeptide (TPR) repeat protein
MASLLVWLALALTMVELSAAQAPSAGTLDSLLTAAERHHRTGRLAQAHAALAEAEGVALAPGSSAASAARLWTVSGDVYVSQTTATNTGYDEADTAAAKALKQARRSGDARLLADALDLAGRVLYSRRINLAEGDYEKPRSYFQEALELRRKAGDTRGVVESLFRVGLIHERKDQADEAIATYQEAMRLAGANYPLERSNLARHLAYQYQGRGALDKALELFRQSLTLREQAGFELTRPSALNSIGDVYRRMKEYERAMEYNRRALAEAERLEAPRFMVMALISIGDTHAALAQREQALAQWRRAEALAGEIGYVSGNRQARERIAELSR